MSRTRNKELDELFGAKIIKARAIAGLSQMELAESIGVSYQQVQKYERGVNRVSMSTLYRVMKATTLPVEFFFEDIQEDMETPGGKSRLISINSALASPGAKDVLIAYSQSSRITQEAIRQICRDLSHTGVREEKAAA